MQLGQPLPLPPSEAAAMVLAIFGVNFELLGTWMAPAGPLLALRLRGGSQRQAAPAALPMHRGSLMRHLQG